MPYQPPVRDYAFILRDLLELERYANLPAFADASMDTVDQILEEASTSFHRRGAGPVE